MLANISGLVRQVGGRNNWRDSRFLGNLIFGVLVKLRGRGPALRKAPGFIVTGRFLPGLLLVRLRLLLLRRGLKSVLGRLYGSVRADLPLFVAGVRVLSLDGVVRAQDPEVKGLLGGLVSWLVFYVDELNGFLGGVGAGLPVERLLVVIVRILGVERLVCRPRSLRVFLALQVQVHDFLLLVEQHIVFTRNQLAS